MILQPFNYHEVKLDNGSLSRQVEYIKNYYLHIPNDDLLKGFRERVHLPTYGAMKRMLLFQLIFRAMVSAYI